MDVTSNTDAYVVNLDGVMEVTAFGGAAIAVSRGVYTYYNRQVHDDSVYIHQNNAQTGKNDTPPPPPHSHPPSTVAPPTTQTSGGGSQPPASTLHSGMCGCDGPLYRGLHPDEDPSQGIFPRNPNNIQPARIHVLMGSRRGYPGDQYISLTRDPVAAARFSSRIVQIDPNMVEGNLIDLSTTSARFAAGFTMGSNEWIYAARASEVLLEGWIPPEAISPYNGDLWSSLDDC